MIQHRVDVLDPRLREDNSIYGCGGNHITSSNDVE
jgi:hypothetical protein